MLRLPRTCEMSTDSRSWWLVFLCRSNANGISVRCGLINNFGGKSMVGVSGRCGCWNFIPLCFLLRRVHRNWCILASPYYVCKGSIPGGFPLLTSWTENHWCPPILLDLSYVIRPGPIYGLQILRRNVLRKLRSFREWVYVRFASHLFNIRFFDGYLILICTW